VNHLPGYHSETADVSVRLTQATLRALLLRQTDFVQARSAGLLELDGQPLKLLDFFGLFDDVDANFPIVFPRPSL
jgi:alkyl sulfatase BDS1-like metallo-beta-lactamase superfamily hydrolase